MAKYSSKILNLKGEKVGEVLLPRIFKTNFRPDVIRRAVVSIQSNQFQPQGQNPHAGKRTTAESRGVGHGISRVPRVKGGQRARLAPGTVGGRSAHPPVSKKKREKKIPKKEMRLALCSAVAATASKEIVSSRGHIVDDVQDFPLVVVDQIQDLEKTREVKEVFSHIGVWPDVCRAKENRKIRAGRGKRRGRKMKRAVGPLLVITENRGIVRAAQNIPGVETIGVDELNVELLAPGTHPGRLTIWTSSAINRVNKTSRGE